MSAQETGKAIAYLRKKKNLTQKDIAERLHVSDKAVSKWERGLALPDVSLLAKLSIMLDTDIESLLEGNIARYEQRWVGLIILDSDDDVFLRAMLFDKPLVYFQLSYFMLVGIQKICIVCSKKSEMYIQGLMDWKRVGIDLSFEHKIFLTSNADSDLMIIYGNVFMYCLDLTKHLQRAMVKVSRQEAESSVLLLQNSNGAYAIEDCRIKEKVENNEFGLRYSISPFLFLSSAAAKDDEAFLLDRKRMFSKALVNDSAYATFGRGLLMKCIKSFEDTNDVANLVRIIQAATGEQIADLDEIARRRGLV